MNARYAASLPAVLFMPASIAIGFVDSSAVALAIICAVTFCHMIWKTNVMTLANDLFPVEWVGSAAGIVSLGSGLGGILFMNLTGQMVEAFSYKTIFFMMGFMHPAALLVCRLMIPGTPAERTIRTDRPLAAYARKEGN